MTMDKDKENELRLIDEAVQAAFDEILGSNIMADGVLRRKKLLFLSKLMTQLAVLGKNICIEMLDAGESA
jgi:hypothetical protein